MQQVHLAKTAAITHVLLVVNLRVMKIFAWVPAQCHAPPLVISVVTPRAQLIAKMGSVSTL